MSRLELDGKRVLLTGASTGIGREMAVLLAERGARLALAARREMELNETAQAVGRAGGSEPPIFSVDLAKRGEAAKLARQASDALDGIDVLINNAASTIHGPLWKAGDRRKARRLLELNFWSPLALIAELLPAMKAQDAGAVANVSSMAQMSPFPALGHYVASKAALSAATETLWLELRGARVTATDVLLGVVDTAGSREQLLIPGGDRWLNSFPKGKPEVAAKRIVTSIERERRRLFYPRAMAFFYRLPSVPRVSSLFLARGSDPSDEVVREAGSQGSAETRAIRREWERQRSGTGPTSDGPS